MKKCPDFDKLHKMNDEGIISDTVIILALGIDRESDARQISKEAHLVYSIKDRGFIKGVPTKKK